MDPITPRPFLELSVIGQRFLFQTASTNKVLDDDAALSASTVLETNDDHAVAFDATAPAIITIFRSDTTGRNLLKIATRADIVVAGEGVRDFAGAGETVIAWLRGLNGIPADVASGGKGERFEGSNIHNAWSCEDRCRRWSLMIVCW
jgi:hypothetical protein